MALHEISGTTKRGTAGLLWPWIGESRIVVTTSLPDVSPGPLPSQSETFEVMSMFQNSGCTAGGYLKSGFGSPDAVRLKPTFTLCCLDDL